MQYIHYIHKWKQNEGHTVKRPPLKCNTLGDLTCAKTKDDILNI